MDGQGRIVVWRGMSVWIFNLAEMEQTVKLVFNALLPQCTVIGMIFVIITLTFYRIYLTTMSVIVSQATWVVTVNKKLMNVHR